MQVDDSESLLDHHKTLIKTDLKAAWDMLSASIEEGSSETISKGLSEGEVPDETLQTRLNIKKQHTV